jgi:Bifunctional DNA primase/polymerase, N-terminal
VRRILRPEERLEEERRLTNEAALLYQGMGFSIIPVHHPWTGVPAWANDWREERDAGKRPLIRWKQYQVERAGPEQVRSWFGGPRLNNIAIPTGSLNGFNVVDLDSEEALAWAREHLPPTSMVVLTSLSGGFRRQHWYYRADAASPLPNRCKLRRGRCKLSLDVRGQGGMVLAPGSRHRSGIVYERVCEWTRRMLEEVPGLDAALIEPESTERSPPVGIVRSPARDSAEVERRARRWLALRDPAIEGSGGDEWTFKTAAALVVDFALDDEVAIALLLEWNRGNRPPWCEAGLRQKVRNARAYARGAVGAKK